MQERRSAVPRIFALSLAASMFAPLVMAGAATAAPSATNALVPAKALMAKHETAPDSDSATLLDSALKPATKKVTGPEIEGDAATVAAKEIRSGIDTGTSLSAAARIKLSEQALEAVGIDALDAQMGQGHQRIEESGDPTAPTSAELEVLASAAEELAESAPAPKNLHVPEPTDPSADPSAASVPGSDDSFDAASAGFTTTSEAFEASQAAVSSPASLAELRTWRPPGVLGIDVSHHQGNVNWSHAWGKGARFAYMKATQSWPTSLFKDPKFAQNYKGSANQGMMRGAYHFAMPAHSSGATQAKQFLANGGGWSADGKTLPPLLDIEWNPYTPRPTPRARATSATG